MGGWTVHAGRGGVYATDQIERSIISISWDFGGASTSYH